VSASRSAISATTPGCETQYERRVVAFFERALVRPA
jgi:hypothetical protein